MIENIICLESEVSLELIIAAQHDLVKGSVISSHTSKFGFYNE